MGRWLGKLLMGSGGGAPPGYGYYAAPGGSATGAGTIGDPWTLAVALAGGYPSNTVQPGDTIWLRGGTYSGTFTSTLDGSAGNLITIRSYTGEWAVIDGGTNTGTVLTLSGSYTIFRDFELTSSSTDRLASSDDSSGPGLNRPHSAIQNVQSAGNGVGCKLVNMIIHNIGQGISCWVDWTNGEVYGCLIYYNGWEGPSSSWGHGFYLQNQAPSTRIIRNNLSFANYRSNFQCWGSGDTWIDNHTVNRNAFFWDGEIATARASTEFLIGGSASNIGNVVTDNAFYGYGGIDLGGAYGGNASIVMTGNNCGFPSVSVANSTADIYFENQTGTPNISGNDIATGWTDDVNLSDYPTNTWYRLASGGGHPVVGSPPTGTRTIVTPNAYETGRGTVIIFNWDLNNTVDVNVSTILTNGNTYAVYHAMDPLGSPVATGTFGGTTITFPMTGLPVEVPTGASAPARDPFPEFAAFIVRKT
jgi:hypothetical protein